MDTGVNPNSVLKLNVGGKQFVTTQGTLLSDQNSMLARMFSTDTNGRIPASQDANGAFFIDRVILNFLRSGKLENVANVDLKFLRNEAEYFCIQGKIKAQLINRYTLKQQCLQRSPNKKFVMNLFFSKIILSSSSLLFSSYLGIYPIFRLGQSYR